MHFMRLSVCLVVGVLTLLSTAPAFAQAVLDMDIAVLPDPAVAGEDLIYTVTISNTGDAQANDVLLLVVHDGRLTIQHGDVGCPSPPPIIAGLEITCEMGDIPPGSSKQATFPFEIPPDFVVPEYGLDNVELYARVDATDADLVSDRVITIVTERADLRVTKMSKPDTTVAAGEEFVYTVWVDNLGPSTARVVNVYDNILMDGAFTLVSAFVIQQPGGSDGVVMTDQATPPNEVQGLVAEMPPYSYGLDSGIAFETGRFVFEVTVTADEPADVNNVVTVQSDTPDPDDANNMAVDAISVEAASDLILVKYGWGEVQAANEAGHVFNVAIPDQDFPEGPSYLPVENEVTAGRRFRYDCQVFNQGPSTAYNVMLRDPLPAGVKLYPGSVQLSQGTYIGGTPGDPLAPTTFSIGTIAPMTDATVIFQVVVDPNVAPGSVLSNSAVATSDSFDMNLGDNYATAEAVVSAAADLGVDTASVPGPVTAGDTLNFIVSFGNMGPSTAQQAMARVIFPPEIEPISAVLVDGIVVNKASEANKIADCVVQDNIVWCEAGTLAPNLAKGIFVTARVLPDAPDGVVAVEAEVWSTTTDPDFGSNDTTRDITIAALGIPAPPTNVQATDGARYESIYVTWDEVVDADAYEVYRSLGSDFAAAQLIVTANEPHYLDYPGGLSPFAVSCDRSTNIVYTYWVVAVNAAGASAPSLPDRGFSAEEHPKSQGAGILPPLESMGDFAVLGMALLAAKGVARRRNRRQ